MFILPIEIMDKIVMMTNSVTVAQSLRDYISDYAFNKVEKRILIYGDVQGGKTKEIIKFIKSRNNETIVLVIQNSLLVLNQYIQRLSDSSIDFQVVSKNTLQIDKKLIIVMNNAYRYAHFKLHAPNRFILMLDESDQTLKSCPLKGYKTVHITATPFNTKRSESLYDHIIRVPTNENYFGLDKLNINLCDSLSDTVSQFLKSNSGIMLINKYIYINEMQECASNLTFKYPNIPVVLLTSNKTLYVQGKQINVNNKNISKIIDSLAQHKHIVFIANRLANRGLSYVSSDYARHITHQIGTVKSNPASFLQSLRILGIYKNNPKLTLTIGTHEETLLQKHIIYIENFKLQLLKDMINR
jgi:hypothetical protein